MNKFIIAVDFQKGMESGKSIAPNGVRKIQLAGFFVFIQKMIAQIAHNIINIVFFGIFDNQLHIVWQDVLSGFNRIYYRQVSPTLQSSSIPKVVTSVGYNFDCKKPVLSIIDENKLNNIISTGLFFIQNAYMDKDIDTSRFTLSYKEELDQAIEEIHKEYEQKISEIFIASEAENPWPPCGMCRQVMAEFATPDTKVTIVNMSGKSKEFNFADLFPESFGPQNF